MANYSYRQLQDLWVEAGGPAALAPVMAAVALAESGGNPGATNPQDGGCGLFQITPAETGCSNPLTNAQQAVRKYNSQGLGAWVTYTNGAYKPFMQPGVVPSAGAAAATSGSSSGAPDPCCIFQFPLFGGAWCMDIFIGFGAAALGLLAIAAGIVMMSGRPVGPIPGGKR